MPFSRLFVILIFLGIVPVVIGSFLGLEFYIFLLYNLMLIALLLLDYFKTPGKTSFEVERICDEKLSMGGKNEISIQIRNNSDYTLTIEAIDQVPLFIDAEKPVVEMVVEPHSENLGKYIAVPRKRGEYTFGEIHIRYRGIMGLCSKKIVFDCSNNYKVYPNLKDLSKYGLAMLKKSQLLYGMKKVRSFGMGTEFESLKEYNTGDDYKKLNWMVSARHNKLIVNTYEPEKNQQIMVMLDSSRVMNSEINYIKKLDYCINSAFLLTDIALKKGDNVGVMVFDSSVKRFVKPGKGGGQFQLIAENLYNVEENFVTADYRGALTYLNQYQKRRSLLCIFTELFDHAEALELAISLKSFAKHHIPLVITIKDMRLYQTADSQIKEFGDIFTKASGIKLVGERQKIQKVFNDYGIAVVDVPPDRLSAEVVNKYLAMKSMMQI